MAGGAKNPNFTIRRDLTAMVKELDFSDLKLSAERVAPTVTVAKSSGNYPVLPRESMAKEYDTSRSPEGSFSRGVWDWESDSYVTRPYGHEEEVDLIQQSIDEEFINYEETAATIAANTVLIRREARVIRDTLCNTSIWTGSNNTVGVSNEWDDSANATVWGDVNDAATKVWQKSFTPKSSLTLVISDDLLSYALATDKVAAKSKYVVNIDMTPMDVKERLLATYLGIKEVIAYEASYDSADKGQSSNAKRAMTNEYAFLGKLAPRNITGMNPLYAIQQLKFNKYPADIVIDDYDEKRTFKRIIRAMEFRAVKYNLSYGCLLTNLKTTVSSTTGR